MPVENLIILAAVLVGYGAFMLTLVIMQLRAGPGRLKSPAGTR